MTPLPNTYEQVALKVKILETEIQAQLEEAGHQGLLPTRSNPTDAGLDLYAAEEVTLKALSPGQDPEDAYRAKISTGIAVEFPPGLGLFIHDRSGVSATHGVHRVAGVVDSSYRGPIKVALVNLSSTDYHIKIGDRIAQAILAPIILAKPIRVDELSSTERDTGGFGSTGR